MLHGTVILAAGALVGAVLMLAAGAGPRPQIPGYTYGTSQVPRAPMTMADLDLLKQTLLLTDEDVKYLRQSREVLRPHVDEILDVWYGFVGSNPHLLYYFTNASDGQPNSEYLQAVRARFGQWILDTAAAEFDQDWLDYQFEIARRHHRSGKNKTDAAPSVEQVHYRYIPALGIPITTTLKPFLARGGHSPEDVEKMHAAWVKAVTLQTILWSHPYVRDGQF